MVAQNEIMYSDATADHIIVGQLFETKTQRNLTAETKDRLSRIDFTKLPLADAIKSLTVQVLVRLLFSPIRTALSAANLRQV